MLNRLFSTLILITSCATALPLQAAPRLAAIDGAMREMLAAGEIYGVVTMVVDRDKVLHLGALGTRNRDTKLPMLEDTIFRIASMTKPITGVAIMTLVDRGLIDLDAPVARYLPEFATITSPSGQVAAITVRQLLNHTSGLAEATHQEKQDATSLSELLPICWERPMLSEPGEKWTYSQSAVNAAASIVERVSGLPFDTYLQRTIFRPLGMVDTGHYLDREQQKRLATAYRKDPAKELPVAVAHYDRRRMSAAAPLANTGLYSTASDYASFCQMLLNRGSYKQKQLLSEAAVEELTRITTGAMETGFVPGSGWAVATGVVREPMGITAMLSKGSFGHGGGFGTQAWSDPVRGVSYIMMIQRIGFGNGDACIIRQRFQESAAQALGFSWKREHQKE